MRVIVGVLMVWGSLGGLTGCELATDSSTDATADTAVVSCQSGQVTDCSGSCASVSLLGNGSCDSALNCQALQFDQGDCSASPADVVGSPDVPMTADTQAQQDVVVPSDVVVPADVTSVSGYYAVIVEDDWDGTCASPSTKGEGFDLDAIALYDSADQLVGYAHSVLNRGVVGDTGCGYDNGHADPSEALGAPDGDKDSGYVSLNRGGIGAEFAPNSPVIRSSDVIEVFETSCSTCSDEPFVLKLASTRDCVVAPQGCSILELGSGTGNTSFTVPGAAF